MRISPLIVVFALFCHISPLFSQTRVSTGASDIYRAIAPAVFLIETRTTEGQVAGIGSAFLIEPTRLVTNAHVVEGGKPFLRTGAAALPLRVELSDPNHDLAILVSDLPLEAEPLVLETTEPAVGTEIYTISNPQGLERTLSEGKISAVRDHDGKRLLQITAAISPGSSGGPVVTRDGRVVGVTVGSIEGGQNLNFAIPASTLRGLLDHESSPTDFSAAFAEVQRMEEGRPQGKDIEERLLYIQQRNEALARAGALARTSDEHYALAMFAYSKMNLDLAIKHARLALSTDGEKADSARQLLVLTWDYKMFEEDSISQSELLYRLEVVDSLLSRQASNAYFRTFRARVLARLGRGVEALAEVRRAIELGGNGPEAHWYWVVYHQVTAEYGTPNDDDDVFRQMVQFGFAEDRDWSRHGEHLSKRKLWNEAGAAYNQAFVLSRNAQYACDAGQAYWMAEVTDSALQSFRSCVTRYAASMYVDTADVAYAHRGIASLLNDRGVYSEAENHARQARNLAPYDSWAAFELARAYYGQQLYLKAANAAQEAIRLSDGSVALMHFLAGSAYFELGDWARCERSFYHADKLDPNLIDAAYNRALCLARRGYYQDAASVMEDVLRRKPDHPDREAILRMIQRWRG